VDLPGFGDSPACQRAPGDLVSEFLAAFPVPPVLVGPSMSGKLALDLALAAPGRVGGLILIAPVKVAEVAPHLGRIAVPTLVLWGDRDAVAPVAEVETLTQGLPDVRAKIYKGASHPCYLDQPDAWHRDLVDFLTQRFDGA
jgi:abhydrolase domain-containing protein 14